MTEPNVTREHRATAYRLLNKGALPGPEDHQGRVFVELGVDGAPQLFREELLVAYGIALGEQSAKEATTAALEFPEGTAP